MKNTVFVTGSSGFIGSHLIRLLIAEGYDVWGGDIRVPEYKEPELTFRSCDLTCFEKLAQVMVECSPRIVIHLAARTDLDGRSLSDYAANTDGVRNLVRVVAGTPSVERVVYTSSQLVCRVGYVPQDDLDFCPNTVYGESKVMTEGIVRELDGGGKAWCLIRPTTIWGAGMNAHYQKFFRMVASNRYFFVSRKPLVKTYGYVGNAVHQVKKIAEAPLERVQGKVFYLADYEPLALRSWITAIQRELGARPIPTISLPLARVLAMTGDMLNKIGYSSFLFTSFRLKNILTEYQFDMGKTEALCGPLPYKMEDGVKALVKWIQIEVMGS